MKEIRDITKEHGHLQNNEPKMINLSVSAQRLRNKESFLNFIVLIKLKMCVVI